MFIQDHIDFLLSPLDICFPRQNILLNSFWSEKEKELKALSSKYNEFPFFQPFNSEKNLRKVKLSQNTKRRENPKERALFVFFANWANCANVENVMFALFVGANVVQTIFSFCSVIAKTLCPEQLNRWWPCLSSFTPRVFTQLQSYHRHLFKDIWSKL